MSLSSLANWDESFLSFSRTRWIFGTRTNRREKNYHFYYERVSGVFVVGHDRPDRRERKMIPSFFSRTHTYKSSILLPKHGNDDRYVLLYFLGYIFSQDRKYISYIKLRCTHFGIFPPPFSSKGSLFPSSNFWAVLQGPKALTHSSPLFFGRRRRAACFFFRFRTNKDSIHVQALSLSFVATKWISLLSAASNSKTWQKCAFTIFFPFFFSLT